jgi:ATP-binding cassette subfamily B (MDR/TAP) protein 1
MASRLAVFDAIKAWRRNRTTIVITHDLSQIQPTDFVYLMKDGRLTEQGYRADLMVTENSEFAKLATLQAEQPLLEKDRDPWAEADQEVEMILEDIDQQDSWRKTMRRSTMQIGPAHPSRGYLDYLTFIDDQEKSMPAVSSYGSASGSRVSALAKLEERRASHVHQTYDPSRLPAIAERRFSTMGRQLSTRFERQSVTYNRHISRNGLPRHSMFIVTTGADGEMADSKGTEMTDPDEAFVATIENAPKLYRVIRDYFPGMPKKWLLVFGSICSIAHGVMTPLWSKYIAALMADVSYGGADTSGITKTSIIVIGITIANAASLTGQSFLMESMSAYWVSGLRTSVYEKVLSQPQSWFDKRSNSPSRLVQVLIKDVDDMKEILSTIIGRSITAGVMVVVGLAWAMAIGWKLTLVGVAVGPIFAIMVVLSSRVNTGLEAKNKEAREQVSRTLYEVSFVLYPRVRYLY